MGDVDGARESFDAASRLELRHVQLSDGDCPGWLTALDEPPWWQMDTHCVGTEKRTEM